MKALGLLLLLLEGQALGPALETGKRAVLGKELEGQTVTQLEAVES